MAAVLREEIIPVTVNIVLSLIVAFAVVYVLKSVVPRMLARRAVRSK